MSLETYLQENTRALLALTEILKNGLGATVLSPEALEEQVLADAEKPKAKKAKKEAAPEPRPLEQTAPSPDAGAADASATGDAAPQTEPVTREQVSKALTTLANKKGREAAMKVLAEAGAKNLGEVATTHYGSILAACEKALA